MTLPCEQQSNILNIARTLERMEDGQRSIVRLLEKVSNQEARLENIEDWKDKQYEEVSDIESRLREIELSQASNGPLTKLKISQISEGTKEQLTSVIEEFSHKINEINTRLEKVLRFFKIITGKWAIYVYGGLLFMIIFGFISDLANHTDWIKSIWHFWRQGS